MTVPSIVFSKLDCHRHAEKGRARSSSHCSLVQLHADSEIVKRNTRTSTG